VDNFLLNLLDKSNFDCITNNHLTIKLIDLSGQQVMYIDFSALRQNSDYEIIKDNRQVSITFQAYFVLKKVSQ
jgi:hypothetical protein